MIAETEGGLMDRDIGIRVATTICCGCEKRGPPAVMYDPASKMHKYLQCEVGMSDSESIMRQMVLKADVDMPEDTVRAAMQQGAKEGYVSTIPDGMVGKLEKLMGDAGGGGETLETGHPTTVDLRKAIVAKAKTQTRRQTWLSSSRFVQRLQFQSQHRQHHHHHHHKHNCCRQCC